MTVDEGFIFKVKLAGILMDWVLCICEDFKDFTLSSWTSLLFILLREQV